MTKSRSPHIDQLVFLRVLEYHDGELRSIVDTTAELFDQLPKTFIVTSNRVAAFDEALKSRIQIALHYERLSKLARKRVWENFLLT